VNQDRVEALYQNRQMLNRKEVSRASPETTLNRRPTSVIIIIKSGLAGSVFFLHLFQKRTLGISVTAFFHELDALPVTQPAVSKQ